MKEAFPTVKKIVLMEGGGDLLSPQSLAANGDDVITWEELLDMGRSVDDQILEECEKDQSVNQAAMMLYTSGTTGPPKGTYAIHHIRYSEGINLLFDILALIAV